MGYIFICRGMPKGSNTTSNQKRASDLLELQLEEVMNYPAQMLDSELRNVLHALNCLTFPPASALTLLPDSSSNPPSLHLQSLLLSLHKLRMLFTTKNTVMQSLVESFLVFISGTDFLLCSLHDFVFHKYSGTSD